MRFAAHAGEARKNLAYRSRVQQDGSLAAAVLLYGIVARVQGVTTKFACLVASELPPTQTV